MEIWQIRAADYEGKKKSLTNMLLTFYRDGQNIEDPNIQQDAAIQCGFNLNELTDFDIALIIRKVLMYEKY